MAQKRTNEPAGTLEELESIGERLAQWVGANPMLVMGGAALILALAAGAGGYRAYAGSRTERASSALAAVRSELLTAMGGKPSDAEIPEPANPETARSVRTDFAERYLAVAKDWNGTPTQGLALLEAGHLLDQLGNADRALEVWTEATAATRADSPALGILQSRIATLQEQKGDFEAAARAYEAAAAVPGFPLAAAALSDAARCWDEAGKSEPALAAYRRVKVEFPEYRMAPYVEAALTELELRTGGGVAAGVAPPAPSP